MECYDLFSDIRDILVAGAAVATAIIAWLGLSTWRKKLGGGREFKLAHKILISTNRIRMETKRVRVAAKRFSEFPKTVLREGEDPKILDSKEINKRENLYIYTNRLRALQELQLRILTLSTEAEAIWDRGIRDAVENLSNHINKLELHIFMMFNRDFQGDSQARQITFDIVYESSDDAVDVYRVELERAIKAIEEIVKPHIRKYIL